MAGNTSETYTVTFDDKGNTYVDGALVKDGLGIYLQQLHSRHMTNTRLVTIHTALCSGCEGNSGLCGYSSDDELSPDEEQRVMRVANRIAALSGSLNLSDSKQLEIAARYLTEWSAIING